MPNTQLYNDLSTIAANTFTVISGLYAGISLLKKSTEEIIFYFKKRIFILNSASPKTRSI